MGKKTNQAELPPGRMVYFVPIDAYIEGEGFRASVVVENESGHYPTGSWPYDGRPGQSRPYFFGHDYDEACAHADRMNENLGYSKEQVLKIVGSSMSKSTPRIGT